MSKNKSFTDQEGTAYIYDSKTRLIKTTMDKHGNIYDSKGKRIGHIDDGSEKPPNKPK